MTPGTFLRIGISPALSLLPSRMDTPNARAMVLAIALQESRLIYRRQMGEGPARGYAQFEVSGIAGVLSHPASIQYARQMCEALDIVPAASAVHAAIEFNDTLAAAFARLLLWTDSGALPARTDPSAGWQMYLRTWRPGRPHPERWLAQWAEAWEHIDRQLT